MEFEAIRTSPNRSLRRALLASEQVRPTGFGTVEQTTGAAVVGDGVATTGGAPAHPQASTSSRATAPRATAVPTVIGCHPRPCASGPG